MKQRERKKKLKSTTFDELERRVNLGTRKVQRNKTTSSGYVAKCLSLPKTWVESNNIKVGDEVELTMEKNGTLSVRKFKGADA